MIRLRPVLLAGAVFWAAMALAGARAAAAPGGDGLPFGPAATDQGAGASDLERQKADEIQSAYEAGQYGKVVEAAKAFLRDAKDDRLKAGAAWALASALRKQGEWRQTPSAYQSARDVQPAGSDGFVKCDAIAEVLRASREGIYLGLKGAPPEKAATGTLADDEVLEAALVRLAESRVPKVEAQTAAIRRLRTPPEVVSALDGVLEAFRRIRILKPDFRVDHDREAAKGAGGRMADLANGVVATLREKQTVLEGAVAARRVTSVDKKSARKWKGMCDDLAKTEEAFAKVLAKVPGGEPWEDGTRLSKESADRLKEYKELSAAFAKVEAAGSGSDWNDWREPPRGGGRAW